MKKRINGRIIRVDNSRRDLREPCIEKCIGCTRCIGLHCTTYLNPSTKWTQGNCPMASHVSAATELKSKKRVGQQKQRK